jgi:nitrogen fixation protein FixH
MQASAAERPWTGRMVLLSILAFFGVVIAVNVTMMTLAIKTLPGIDIDNPYGTGLAYNQEISAARAQDARGWHVAAHVERAADGRGSIALEARDVSGAAVTGVAFTARLARPTDRRSDLAVTLVARETGVYLGVAEDVAAGQWELIIEGDRGSERLFLSHNRLTLR